jgi:imidazolonepropionase-like amidohydrolase
LRAGVTAARDPGVGLNRYDAAVQRGKKIPRMFLTGEHLDQQPFAHPTNAILVGDAEDARSTVNRFVDQGASAIKVYFRLPPELIRVVCQAADARGVPVVGHLELVDADAAIEAGLDGLEHVSSVGTAVAEPAMAEAFRAAVDAENSARMPWRFRLWASLDVDSPRSRRMVEMIARRGVYMSPTLTYFYGTGPGSKKPTDENRRGFANMLEFVQRCHAAGAKVVVGSHTMLGVEPEGKAFQKEMELLVEAGMKPKDVIVAATMEGARFLRAEKRIGSIEPGKLADLILIDGDPLKDIRAMRNVRRVMLNGVWNDDASSGN